MILSKSHTPKEQAKNNIKCTLPNNIPYKKEVQARKEGVQNHPCVQDRNHTEAHI